LIAPPHAASPLSAPALDAAASGLDVVAVHRAHGDFVWRSLQRLGVRPSDLEDRFQDVFVVVHQRLHTFRGASQLTTWLFGICVRVVASHRRRAWFRREALTAEPPEPEATAGDRPDAALAAREARALVDRVLDEMDLDKRAILVMFEVDELPCEEIATLLGVPVGTVWSRVSAARKQFQTILARHGAPAGGLGSTPRAAPSRKA
jgi:RNA polymerase sigma-70 factor (ECF subfamily)